MTKFHFDIFQQAYCFSMASCGIGEVKGSEKYLQDVLKNALEENFLSLTGNWSIGWGPRVFKDGIDDPAKGPDHTCFAAVDHDQKVCIVAIAGTAEGSEADGLQNKQVDRVVDFTKWSDSWSNNDIPIPEYLDSMDEKDTSRSYVAEGLTCGARNILNSPSNDASSGQRLDSYLRGLGQDYTIIITGHSLGGGLAPIVAMGLHQSNLVSNKNLKVLPSAGVSPGNDIFAKEFTAAFPPSPTASKAHQIFNTVYYNVYDFVPQAWSLNKGHDRNMDKIFDIYKFSALFRFLVGLFIDKSKSLSRASGVPYTPLEGTAFQGSVKPPTEPIENKEQLGQQIGIQHIVAYWNQLGIHEFMDAFMKCIPK